MRTITLVISLILSCLVSAQNSTDAVTKFINSKALKHATTGISIIDLSNSKTVIAHNEQSALTPASLTKIVTTATAFEMLEVDYKIPTTIGYTGTLTNGVVKGNIVIIGAGDPTTESKYFKDRIGVIDSWITAIKDSGIKAIEGSIVMQSENFSKEAISSRWIWEDMGNYYGSGVYPFSITDNTYTIAFKSGKAGTPVSIIEKSAEADELVFRSDVIAAANNKDSAYIYGSPLDKIRYIHGSIPEHRERFEIKGSISNPPLELGKKVKIKMEQAGITCANEVMVEQQSRSYITPIKTYYSPTIKEIIKPTNHKSINLFADHLFWQLSLASGKTACVRNSYTELSTFWKEKGIDTEALQLWDGSGLSPQNTVSPAFLTDMLVWINSNSANRTDFIETLPIAGKSGTVKRFLADTRLSGKVCLKSGSMDRVRCYAGYVMKNGSPQYAFAIMVNHFSNDSKAVIKAIEMFMLDLL